MSDKSTSPITMTLAPDEKKKLTRYSLIFGILLLILGSLGFFLPLIVSLATNYTLAALLVIGGIIWGFYGIKNDPKNFLNWLKPVLLIITGSLMVLFPVVSIEALTLWLAFYLMLDMAGSFALAFKSRPEKGWVWMLFNGVVSLVLATLILINWPAISEWIIGMYISISLMFDGIALLFLPSAIQQNTETLTEENDGEEKSPTAHVDPV